MALLVMDQVAHIVHALVKLPIPWQWTSGCCFQIFILESHAYLNLIQRKEKYVYTISCICQYDNHFVEEMLYACTRVTKSNVPCFDAHFQN